MISADLLDQGWLTGQEAVVTMAELRVQMSA
jgi:hypothetical protein